MDIETLEKVIDILKKERVHLSMAISGCYDAIKEEANKEDPDALFDAVVDLRECEQEQHTIRRLQYRIEQQIKNGGNDE